MGDVFDLNEAARILEVSYGRLHSALNRKGGLEVPKGRVGTRVIFTREDIERARLYFSQRKRYKVTH